MSDDLVTTRYTRESSPWEMVGWLERSAMIALDYLAAGDTDAAKRTLTAALEAMPPRLERTYADE